MNSFALITAIALAADFSVATASIARARMLKALRKSLTTLAAFVIVTSFIASSFASQLPSIKARATALRFRSVRSSGWSTTRRSRRNSAL
jgi:hypothetical protein